VGRRTTDRCCGGRGKRVRGCREPAAQAAGLTVTALAAVPPERLTGDARKACDDAVASGTTIRPFDARELADCEVVVDALLGTGLSSAVREDAARVIEAINAAGKPVLAIDVPSGLDSDSGAPLGVAVRADATVTFVGLKTGLFFGDGPEYAGTVFFDDLEVVPPERPELVPRLERLTEADIARALPRRARSSHKGDFGRVLLVGGGPGMPGAMRLAGEACLRAGAGLVTVAVAPENVTAIVSGRPELILLALPDAAPLAEAAERADVLAIGPGLGRSSWACALLDAVLAAGKPTVIDADALNLLAERTVAPRGNWILTPHPGEAARLLRTSTAEVQDHRLRSLDALVARYGGTVVLKGAGTLIGSAGRIPALCERGNPGMATAGMGDVLTGAIAGILAQCRDPWLATRAGVLAHAMAGDSLARTGQRGILARDVAKELHSTVNI